MNRGRSKPSPKCSGAGKESRTLDLNLGKVALYQLSYSRIKCNYSAIHRHVNVKSYQTRFNSGAKSPVCVALQAVLLQQARQCWFVASLPPFCQHCWQISYWRVLNIYHPRATKQSPSAAPDQNDWRSIWRLCVVPANGPLVNEYVMIAVVSLVKVKLMLPVSVTTSRLASYVAPSQAEPPVL